MAMRSPSCSAGGIISVRLVVSVVMTVSVSMVVAPAFKPDRRASVDIIYVVNRMYLILRMECEKTSQLTCTAIPAARMRSAMDSNSSRDTFLRFSAGVRRSMEYSITSLGCILR